MTTDTRLKFESEIAKLIAETAKINAETDKIRIEKALYPMVAASAFTAAMITVAKLFL
jgi:hypothetical protein